jgi:hypothetical protein
MVPAPKKLHVAEGKSGIDRAFVDDYSKIPENIIEGLERELGITSNYAQWRGEQRIRAGCFFFAIVIIDFLTL